MGQKSIISFTLQTIQNNMKTKYFISICILSLLIISCSKEDDDITASETSNNGTMECGGSIAEVVDLGLQVKWASHNLGANKEGDSDGFYAWGLTHTNFDFCWDNYPFVKINEPYSFGDKDKDYWLAYFNPNKKILLKYNTDANFDPIDNKTKLDLEDDAAHVNWGGSWRLPTTDEINELITECVWENQSHKDSQGEYIDGYKVTGPNGNFIFIPIIFV